jgi:fructosamine-3-kinase
VVELNLPVQRIGVDRVGGERLGHQVLHSHEGNLIVRNIDHLATIVRNRLKRIQYRPELLNGFLTQAGLTLEAQPP